MKAARVLRVALVSDTHGFLDARIASVVQQCDWVVHAGDVGAALVLNALRPRGGRVVAIRGNNDVLAKWPAEDAGVLDGLPLEAVLELPGGRLVVVHGDRCGPASRRHEWLRRRHPLARAVVYGHSHHPVCDRSAEPWVLNPGAAGRARTCGGPACMVLHATRREWHVELQRFPPLEPARRPRALVYR